MEDMAQVLQAQVDCSVQALAPIKQSLAKLTAAEVVAVGKTQIEAINDFINRTMKGLLTEKIDGLTAVTQQMGQVMEGLDPSDFEDKPATAPSLMQRMLGKKEAPVNVLTKYEGLGAQLEQAFIAMTQYKRTLTKNNEDLQRLFDENLDYYRFLAQHEQAFAEREIELERQLVYVKDDFARTTLEATREMISIRRNDFMMARSVSTQLAVQLYMLSENNDKMLARLDNGLIYTVPIFKQLIAQALQYERARLANQALATLPQWQQKVTTTKETVQENLQAMTALASDASNR